MKESIIAIHIFVENFEQVFGRKPESESEFKDFCYYFKKGLEYNIDWDIVFTCAKEAVENKSRGWS